MPSCLALYWMERQDLGQGAFLSLISVKFSFWKGRSGKGHVCSAMVGGRHGEKPPGGVRVAASRAHRPLKKLLVLPPSALSPCCFLFPFFKAWRPRQPSLPPAVLLRWRSAGWGSHLPSSLPQAAHSHLLPALGCSPSISSSLPPAMARRQVLPGVRVTPLGWFGPRLVPGCLSPEMYCFGALYLVHFFPFPF